jgi:hypothetical protein
MHNTVTINEKLRFSVPGSFDLLKPKQLTQIGQIVSKNTDYNTTASQVLLGILPKNNWGLKWQMFRCLLIRVPILNRFAYGGLLFEHYKKMFVHTDFILKPLPVDWGEKLTWGQYTTLADNYPKMQKPDGTVAFHLFFTTLTDLCHPHFKAIPYTKNQHIQDYFVREYIAFMKLISESPDFKPFFSGKKGKKQAFGYMAITDELATRPDLIPNIESAQALNAIMHIVRLIEKKETKPKKS